MLYELNRNFINEKDFQNRIAVGLEKLEIDFYCVDGKDFICTFPDGRKFIFTLIEVKNGIALLDIDPIELTETIKVLNCLS
ncbi:hypothetical protein [Cetobacterium sp. SF1]|uniref:hypothetical protein n=1 Tax=unclassified Cetobacterium TaxID=2630983 RepID=UPI003CF443F2